MTVERLIIEELKKEKILEKFLSNKRYERNTQHINDIYILLEKIFSNGIKFEDQREKVVELIEKFDQIFPGHLFPRYKSFFKSFMALEDVLYIIKPKYRDHLRHPLVIFIYMIFSLNKIFQINDKLLQSPDRHHTPCFSDYTLHTIFVVSLFHDIGYPIQDFQVINNNLAKLYEQYKNLQIIPGKLVVRDQLRLLLSDYLNIIASEKVLTEMTQDEAKLLLTDAWDKFDHGIISALWVFNHFKRYSLVYTTFAIQSFYELSHIYRVISASIGFHNNKFNIEEGKIGRGAFLFELNPYLFLLRIFDELHDFDRPSLVKRSFKEKSTSFKIVHLEVNSIKNIPIIEIQLETDDIDGTMHRLRENLGKLHSYLIGVKISIKEQSLFIGSIFDEKICPLVYKKLKGEGKAINIKTLINEFHFYNPLGLTREQLDKLAKIGMKKVEDKYHFH